MPLPQPRTPGATIIRAFGNAYLDAAANTVEFGARIYNTAEAARERALSHSIRDNLTYLGPIEVNTTVTDEFITAGQAADAPRQEAVRAERERVEAARSEVEQPEAAARSEAEQQEAADAAEDPDSTPAATPDGTPRL